MWQLTESSFKNSSLQSEELAAAYKKSFEQQSHQQDKLQRAYLSSPTRALQLSSLQQKEPYKIESFNQLDLEISLSLTWFGSTSFSYQLQADSFDRSSFELRALPCTAWILSSDQRSFQLSDQRSFQLTGIQLTGLVQGGAFNIASQKRASSPPLHCTASTLTSLSSALVKPFRKIAWRRRTLPALTLSSLSLALSAWLKSSSKTAWRSIALRQSFSTPSLAATSFRRIASTQACSTRTFRTTSSFRRTFPWFSFLLIIFFSISFRRQEIEKEDELFKTVLEQELEELLANKSCSLGPYDHLEQENLWQIQLQQLSLEKNKKKQQKQLSATVPDRELCQLHLYQLCLQDPDSAIRRQLPEEPLSASGLSDSSLASSSSDRQTQLLKAEACRTGSFQHQLGQVLPRELWQTAFRTTASNRSFHRPEAASGEQAYPEHLPAAQLRPAQLQREDLAEGACNNLCQEQLDRQPCLSELLPCQPWLCRRQLQNSLAKRTSTRSSFQKAHLYPERRRSLQRTASHNYLSSSQLEPAAFQQQLGSAEWGQSSFTTRTSSQRASRRRACRQEL